MKKKILIYFVGLMVACTIIGRVANGMSMPRVSVEKPKSDFVTHTIKSAGIVEKNAEEGLYTIPNMLVKKIHVNVGDNVKRDDDLLEVDIDVLEEELTNKKTELKKIELQRADEESQNQVSAENRERNIRHAQESYNQAVANADNQVWRAQQEFESAKRLYEDAGDISTEELDALLEDANAKSAALQQAEQARSEAILSATQALEVAMASEAVKNTQASLDIDQGVIKKDIKKLEELKKKQGIIKATVDGVVTSVAVGTGEQTGTTAAILLADSSKGYRFVAEITKEQNKYLTIGQEVSLSAAGKSEKTEKVKIESIIASADDAEVMHVAIPVTAEQFYIGESVEMEAHHGVKKYPICLPISALGEENKKHFVYLLKTEKTIMGEALVVRKQHVTVLDKNEEIVAVVAEDITSEQEVVVEANKKLQDGIRVRMDES